ncbi:MAG: formate--phosphoribosylaminoimidazolecarboxamide ligase family protein [Nitrososphaera sp.]|uniref:5-formaminoimidazole-4-carboxamide-1-(Beta)-D-ribofuranosyl 5'-monophosphate ligase n=1 Tax=Nitrososphaera gargensis (strain Ga9.2) TaxID=1237085 RepID=K0IE82_NITGG|nr:formate--phosphoribosylaminoimidazolecarboxamide ligase family protein [Candidatus Nitrososphaera gargensis]AFU59666.1 5-formaminoimidazole-4-carboxamide-1-(beta)-D-ribofuranosyl 5'-monophosphate ligase [Candidatus Nitrososphaera gargensis Ga9.2]
MIGLQQIASIVDRYDPKNVTVGTIGSHSALEVMDGAKDEGMKTVCICQKGRDLPYRRFKRLADEIILLDKFSDIMNRENQERLRELNTIMVAHRAFTAYLGYDNIENNLKVPIFGNRSLLRAEERTAPRNQYYLLEKAGIRHPKLYRKSSDIDGPAMIKVQEAKRKLERAFFIVSSYEDYKKKSKQKIEQGLVTKQDLDKATIEEYVPGTYFNLNYFVSPLTGETEFLGIERRLQTNVHDFVSLPARQQIEMDLPQPSNIEVGHTPASIRESLLEKVFEMGDKFAVAVRKEYPPGVIGPISLQSVVTTDLDFVVYDVSLRVPGNPIMATTSPYTKYYYGHTMGVGRRIAMEIKDAAAQRKLRDIVT